MDSAQADGNNIRTIISQLSKTVRHIDKHDLTALAKMHGWCENIADFVPPSDETIRPEATAEAQSLGSALEQLILGEVDDASIAFEKIVQSVERLATLVEDPVDTARQPEHVNHIASKHAPETHIAEQEPKLSDDIDEKLARLFDDAPEAKIQTTAQNEGDRTPELEPAYVSEPLILDLKELEFVKGFVEEAREHIESIETALLEVEREPNDADKINDLFRPFHTIKGMAGFLHLRDINCLTHEAETLLDQARKGKRPVTPGMIDLVFNVVDILKEQVGCIATVITDPPDGPIPQPPVEQMILTLRTVVAGQTEPKGMLPAAGTAENFVGENLVAQGATTPNAVQRALELQQNQSPSQKVGQVLVKMGEVTPRQVSQALRPQAQDTASGPKAKGTTDTSIRIETEKLDSLIDMVGELVIAQTLVQANDTIASSPGLLKNVAHVTKIIRDVQEVAMAMRMIPIGPTFQRMARLTRDVSRKAGKEVKLTISGEDTELDKNVIQQIGDPLVHMVRNAVDHGIESPDARRKAGKPEVGEVHLHAGHQGGSIIIEISDDGAGLDPEVLAAKAVEKGIIAAGTELSEQQAFHLIFAPGFSTAATITDISGRGVGMDVVKRNIEQLRGKIEITSRKGLGSTFTIRLPLTLAIIDGMVVRLGKERFIIPTIAIEQSLRPSPQQVTTIQHRGEVLNVRGQLVPLVQLGTLFGLTGRLNPCETMVLVANGQNGKVGLVVEELIGQQQVVIKNLGHQFEKLDGIAGASILGDGRVGLILEVSGLVDAHAARTDSAYDGSDQHADRHHTEPMLATRKTEEPEMCAVGT